MALEDKNPEDLARHFSKMGDHKQAYRCFVEAGDLARPSSSTDTLAYYEAALKEWDPRDHPNEISRDDVNMLIRHAHHFALCSRREEARAANQRIFQFLTDDMLLERGKALRSRGYISMVSIQNVEQGEKDLLEALEIFKTLQEPELIANALRNLTSLYRRTGQASSVVATTRLAAEAHRDHGDTFSEGFALLCEGDLAFYRCRFLEARQLFEEAFDQLRDENDKLHAPVRFVLSFGLLYFYIGEFDQANTVFHEGLDRCRKLGVVGSVTDLLVGLSDVAFEQGHMVRAEAFAREALDCSPEYSLVRVYVRLAAIRASVGDEAEAMRWFEKAGWEKYDHVEHKLYLSLALSMMGHHEKAEAGFAHLANVERAKRSCLGACGLGEAGAFYSKIGQVERARELLQSAGSILSDMGAAHFAHKAFRLYRELPEQPLYIQKQTERRDRFGALIGQSDVMQRVYALLEQASESDVTVLLRGETGTGKEIAAKELHLRSGRLEGSFLSLNCSALSDELLQSELFGHRKGAFTGAGSDRAGLFEAADGGTLFLDEIGDASDRVQSNLLRVLQEGEIRRIGENITRKVNVRVITATNRDLETAVNEGRFRKDLYYRLQVFQIEMPPLRERIEDIALLAAHFLTGASHEDCVFKLGRDAMHILMDYNWPGNVRELENEIRRAVVLSGAEGSIGAGMFSEHVRLNKTGIAAEGTLQTQVIDFEKQVILETLSACGGNMTRAATRLGLSRQGLYKKMTRYGLRD